MKKSLVMMSMFLGLSMAAVMLPTSAHANHSFLDGDPDGGGEWYSDELANPYVGSNNGTDTYSYYDGFAYWYGYENSVGGLSWGANGDDGHGFYIQSKAVGPEVTKW